jgi:hypothetical protein
VKKRKGITASKIRKWNKGRQNDEDKKRRAEERRKKKGGTP